METTGRAHEGWMAAIPLAVLLFVFVMFGDPAGFVNAVSDGVVDLSRWAVESVRLIFL